MSRGMLIMVIILLVLVALWFLRLGGRVYYTAEGVKAQVKIGWLYFTVYPMKKSSKPKKSKEKAKKSKPKKPKPKKEGDKNKVKKGFETTLQLLEAEQGGDTALIEEGISAVGTLLGKSLKSIRVDELTLHYTIAGRHDAAGAAIQYGTVFASGGVLYPLICKYFTVKKADIGARVDFSAEKAKVCVCMAVSVTVGQLILLLIQVLRMWFKLQKELKRFKEYQKAQEKAKT